MLPNERFALDCLQRYEENGDIVDASNGQFAHCPQPERYGDKGYYLTWEDHQHQGILQSKDIGECCFFSGDVKKWLLECDPFPENYFELWDIYEEYVRKAAENIHAEKDELGRSVNAVKGAKKTHEEKDELGRSVQGVKAAERLHAEKDEFGRSLRVIQMNAEKDELGRSVRGVKLAERINAQIWESTVDGFRSTAGPVALHNKAKGWDPAARIRIS